MRVKTLMTMLLALLFVTGGAIAQDYDARFKAMKKCDTLSKRATELAWDNYKLKIAKCAEMSDRVGNDYASEASSKARKAMQQCKTDAEKERQRTLEDISMKHDDCFDAASDL